jgi:2-polyprenyl-6-methoxyphenol hydroxylase-like FAD-dependent oxidoreductase
VREVKKQRTAEIAGAGFAGLTLATALAQRGWKVTVHERASEVRAFGAGIWVFENGIQALSAIGAADEAFAGRRAASEFLNWDGRGRILYRVKYADLDSSSGIRVFIITRQRLLMAIYHAAQRAGVEVLTNSKVVGADASGALLLENGGRAEADLVVGADGVHSRVRDSLGLLKYRKEHMDGAIRLLVPHLSDYADTWSDDILRSWWNGSRRVLYNPCEGNLVYLCLTSQTRDREGSAVPLNKESWIRSFPNLAALISRIGEDLRYDVFVTTKLHRWSRGRVAIVGDAAHSMVPGLGQGCGISLTNALSLANVLGSDPDDIPTALESWERRARPTTEKTQYWSSIVWPKTRWPLSAVRLFYNLPLWDSWIMSGRNVAARSLPVGSEGLRRWYPPDVNHALSSAT